MCCSSIFWHLQKYIIIPTFLTLSCLTSIRLSYASASEKKITYDQLNEISILKKNSLPKTVYCEDDIYTQYLKNKYLSQFLQKKKKQSKKSVQKNNTIALIKATNELNPSKINQVSSLPITENDSVSSWMQYYKGKGRLTFVKWLVRGSSVQKIIEHILKETGVPSEFFYMAMVESGFNNQAHSHARAAGPWQFVPATARHYGLTIDKWVDERRDPVKSTIAAAKYLRDLYAQFGDWYLTMAAYNAGPGKIKRAIKKTGARNFWIIAKSKHIKLETKQYVPKILAVLILAKNQKSHGFHLNQNSKNEFPNHYANLKRPVLIESISAKLNIPKSVLQKWNPELISEITPPIQFIQKKAYSFRLPQTLLAQFGRIEKKLETVRVNNVHRHKIKRGENLITIAKKYKITVDKIKKWNPKTKPKRLRIGKTLTIPVYSYTYKGKL